MKGKKLTTEEFISRSNLVHNNKYNYIHSIYVKNSEEICIICPEHGEFLQRPDVHLRGMGCRKCFEISRTHNRDIFIERAVQIHRNKYNYSKVEYKNNYTKVSVFCNTHKEYFLVSPNKHLSKKCGCPVCRESKGEDTVKLFLDQHNISYVRQHHFNKMCKNPRTNKPLKFDFYLPNYNMCIEFDGIHHFSESVGRFIGSYKHVITQEEYDDASFRDAIKDQYCKINNIYLLRIKYDQNINDALSEYVLSSQKECIMTETFSCMINDCPRCEENHELIEFKRFIKVDSVKLPSHWGTCPKTGEPILLKMIGE